MDIRCIFSDWKENCCLCVVISRDPYVFVNDYRREEVEQGCLLNAPRRQNDYSLGFLSFDVARVNLFDA